MIVILEAKYYYLEAKWTVLYEALDPLGDCYFIRNSKFYLCQFITQS